MKFALAWPGALLFGKGVETKEIGKAGMWGRRGLWLIAWLPAWVVLLEINHRSIHIPYHDSWAFVEQYQEWTEGRYGWRDLVETHNGHPSIPGKLLYFVMLHLLDGDAALLPLVSWGLSAIIALATMAISRPLWNSSVWTGPVTGLFANLSIFTGAQGHTWIWDFVFQNFIPGACLMGALFLFRSTARWHWWRYVAGLGLCSVASLSFGSGFLVGFLVLPLLWAKLPKEYSRPMQTGFLLFWLVGMMLVAWLGHFASATHGLAAEQSASRVDDVASRPVMALVYVLVLLGHTLGQGTVVEATTLSAVVGAVLLGLLTLAGSLLAWRCRTRAGWQAALPWMACCGWAIGNALLICYLRMGSLLETTLAPRYATFMLFMVIGVLFLVIAFWREPALRALLPDRLKNGAVIGGLAAGLLLAGHLSGWSAGWQSFELFHRRMLSEVAATEFVGILPVNRSVQWDTAKGDVQHWLRFLHQRDRLKGIRFHQSGLVSQYKQGVPLGERFAAFLRLEPDGEDSWKASGTCAYSKDRNRLADLILISVTGEALEERFVALAAPRLPDDFLQRLLLRRLYPEHYLGWEVTLERRWLPAGKGSLTLKAYAYDGQTRRIRPMPGELEVDVE